MRKVLIKFENTNKDKLKERKELIEKLLQEDFSNMELNQENLLKAKELAEKYKEAVSDDWSNRPVQIVIANSDGTELAMIK